ncbi:MAG: hypothetical protein KDD14_11445 [Saprospiraceae bacterium]|nr:hypothetical protein [Saprospiraceae bacterium]
MYKKLIVILIAILLQNFAFSQTEKGLASAAEAKAKSQLIIDDITNDDLPAAFEKIRAIWILPEDELDYLENRTIEQLNSIGDRFGARIGNKLVQEDLIESVLYRLTYVVKFEKHGIRIQFIFYNGAAGKWYLNNFKWDDSLSKLFEE